MLIRCAGMWQQYSTVSGLVSLLLNATTILRPIRLFVLYNTSSFLPSVTSAVHLRTCCAPLKRLSFLLSSYSQRLMLMTFFTLLSKFTTALPSPEGVLTGPHGSDRPYGRFASCGNPSRNLLRELSLTSKTDS